MWNELVELRFASALPDHTDSKLCVGVDPEDKLLKLALMIGMQKVEILELNAVGSKAIGVMATSITPGTVDPERLLRFFRDAARLIEERHPELKVQ